MAEYEINRGNLVDELAVVVLATIAGVGSRYLPDVRSDLVEILVGQRNAVKPDPWLKIAFSFLRKQDRLDAISLIQKQVKEYRRTDNLFTGNQIKEMVKGGQSNNG